MFPANSKTTTEYQRLADVPISVFEICMAQTNKTGPVRDWPKSIGGGGGWAGGERGWVMRF